MHHWSRAGGDPIRIGKEIRDRRQWVVKAGRVSISNALVRRTEGQSSFSGRSVSLKPNANSIEERKR
jgi:hypothetical protein